MTTHEQYWTPNSDVTLSERQCKRTFCTNRFTITYQHILLKQMRWPNSSGKLGGSHLSFELQGVKVRKVLVRCDFPQMVFAVSHDSPAR